MRLAMFCSTFALLLAAPAAKADTLRTFALQLPDTTVTRVGNIDLGDAILDGSLTVNVTTGDVVSASVFSDAGPLNFYADTISSKGYSYPPTPPQGGGGGGGTRILVQPIPTSYEVKLYDPQTDSKFDLVLNTISLLDYNGGAICFSGCALSGSVPYNYGGQMIAVSAGGTTSAGRALFLSSTGEPVVGDPGTPSAPGVAVTPEPSTLCLAGSGLLGLIARWRRKDNTCVA